MPVKKPFVFLDLDDTILDFTWAERRALSTVFQDAGLEPTAALLSRYHEINIQQWELLEEGVLTREEVLVTRFERLFEERGLNLPAARIGERYELLLAEGHQFIPGAEELLRKLQGKAHLYIASNGCAAVQDERIKSAGLALFFEGIFISERIGADKPSREYFRRCFAAIPDFEPAQAWMVGDSLTSDIRGGRDAGLHTCWFNPRKRAPRPDIVPDYEIHDLAELPALLGL